jgi:hypothetical protein
MKESVGILTCLTFVVVSTLFAGILSPSPAATSSSPVSFHGTQAAERSKAIVVAEMPTTTTTWATWTANMAGVATGMATCTVRVRSAPSSPLLDRLIKNKPSMWGNKGFYILLGALYWALLGLFVKQILGVLKRQP